MPPMFLLGHGGRGVTGEVVMVDAGYHMVGNVAGRGSDGVLPVVVTGITGGLVDRLATDLRHRRRTPTLSDPRLSRFRHTPAAFSVAVASVTSGSGPQINARVSPRLQHRLNERGVDATAADRSTRPEPRA